MLEIEFYKSISPDEMDRLMTEFNQRMHDVAEARKHHSYNFAFSGAPRDGIDEIATYIGQKLKEKGFLHSEHVVLGFPSQLEAPYPDQ